GGGGGGGGGTGGGASNINVGPLGSNVSGTNVAQPIVNDNSGIYAYYKVTGNLSNDAIGSGALGQSADGVGIMGSGAGESVSGYWIFNPTLKVWNHIIGSGEVTNGNTTLGGLAMNGWYQIQSNNEANWYYFNSQGAMVTGLQLVGQSIYYLSDAADGTQGQLQTGWKTIAGAEYFFAQGSGVLVVYAITPDGFVVDQTGKKVGLASDPNIIAMYPGLQVAGSNINNELNNHTKQENVVSANKGILVE
ncbi:MAG: hypothetical protein Q4F88_05910, partial [Eubacteriales bacterium]|nr:hypothetical protein [Eubacteriales bacterium]